MEVNRYNRWKFCASIFDRCALNKLSFSLVFLAFFLLGATNPSPTRNWGEFGKIKFKKTYQNLGDLNRGELKEVLFHFTNSGSGPLMIQGVHTSCGCIVTSDLVGKVYQPGEGGHLQIKFDSSDFKGKIKKIVTVATNSPRLRSVSLSLRANVKSEVSLNPPVLVYGEIQESTTEEKVTEIKAVGGKPFEVLGLSYNETALSVRLVEEKSAKKIIVSLLPQRPTGLLKENIIVKTNLAHQKEIKLLVRAYITGNLQVEPHYIEFGSLKEDQMKTKDLVIEAHHDWKVFDENFELAINGHIVTNPGDFVSIQKISDVKRSSAPNSKNITVALKRNGHLTGNVRGRLSLKTSEPTQQNVDVNFYAYFH